MCELWWHRWYKGKGEVKEDNTSFARFDYQRRTMGGLKDEDVCSFEVIENYKTFCEMTNPFIYNPEERHNDANFTMYSNVNYVNTPLTDEFLHANLFHKDIVGVLNKIIRDDSKLDYAINLASLRVDPY